MKPLSEKLLAAAEHGYAANPGDHSDLLREAAAIVRAVEGAEDGIADVLHKLDSWCEAYPEDIFPNPTDEQVKQVNAQYPSAVTRISASMGRHMVKHMREMADSIRRLVPLDAAGSAEGRGS